MTVSLLFSVLSFCIYDGSLPLFVLFPIFFLKPTLPALPFGAFAFNIMMFVHMIVLLVLLEMQRRSK